jgi:hypothetical protein
MVTVGVGVIGGSGSQAEGELPISSNAQLARSLNALFVPRLP